MEKINNYYIQWLYMSLRHDFALSLILGLQKAMQFCAIGSVASTRGLKRISIAIPPSSSEISTAVEKATQKAV